MRALPTVAKIGLQQRDLDPDSRTPPVCRFPDSLHGGSSYCGGGGGEKARRYGPVNGLARWLPKTPCLQSPHPESTCQVANDQDLTPRTVTTAK